MPDILTFALVAPLAAMGSLAVGERRGSWTRPGRSALLGLLGACLGIRRDDGAGQAALSDGYALATCVESPGQPLTDYHTAQVPRTQRGVRHATRRAELDADGLSTVLTWREYRTDVAFLVAVQARAGARWPLAELAAAMRQPRFVPFLGRKSCPLSLPMAPQLHAAADMPAALAERAASQRFLPRPPAGFRRYLAVEAAKGTAAPRIEYRRDEPLDRRRWQFDLRAEAIVPLNPSK